MASILRSQRVASSNPRDFWEKPRNTASSYDSGRMTGETMIGLSTGINLAAGTGGFDYIDLDATIHFLHHKNSYERVTICGAQYLINKVAK